MERSEDDIREYLREQKARLAERDAAREDRRQNEWYIAESPELDIGV